MPMSSYRNHNDRHQALTSARLFQCARCLSHVIICTRCDRGNIYCGQACFVAARQYSRCAASKRYQRTVHGRKNHALCQRRYREKRVAKDIIKTDDSGKVIDQGSHLNFPPLCFPTAEELTSGAKEMYLTCDFCKRQCNFYLRRHFLNAYRRVSVNASSLAMAFAQGP